MQRSKLQAFDHPVGALGPFLLFRQSLSFAIKSVAPELSGFRCSREFYRLSLLRGVTSERQKRVAVVG
jgi:hypothetical protein